jgi:hypothetical protein
MPSGKIKFKNLAQFDRDLRDFGESVPRDHLAFQKKIAFELFSRIILKTPVGNPDLWANPVAPPGYVGGRARGNWQMSIISPPDDPIDKIDPNGGSTIASGNAAVAGAKPFETIWIFNNVRYINRLESGDWSRQAPSGMVAVSLAEIEAGLI